MKTKTNRSKPRNRKRVSILIPTILLRRMPGLVRLMHFASQARKMQVSLTLSFILLPLALFAQAPQSFSYQAVVRNGTGQVIANQSVKVKIGILQDSETGTLVWEEEHQTLTNGFGLVNLMVGDSGATVTGGTVATFDQINWSAGNFYLHVQIDLQDGNGYQDLGAAQLLSVPYSLYAKDVENRDDADADPQNELQALELTGRTLTITGGNSVELPDGTVDGDVDSLNEIQDLQLNGNLLSLTLKGNPTVIDLSTYLDNTDEQALSVTGHTLNITGGNSIQLPDTVNDADHDPANEIQDLQLNGNILSVTKNGSATSIDLSSLPG